MSGDERLAPGGRVGGRFLLEAKLGAGSFGTVWRAIDGDTGEAVALKLLRPARVGHALALERFEREAAIMTALDHPGIVRARAFGEDRGVAWLAMDLVAGTSMAPVIGARAQASAPFSRADVTSLLGSIAEALAYAHGHRVVHRDLKPKNVMLGTGEPPEVRVLDFGVAKLLGPQPGDATTVGRLLGSLLYMAPEQLSGGEVGPETDVFALTTLAFELLALRRPWAHGEDDRPRLALDAPVRSDPRNNHASILARITRGPRPSARDFAPELPPVVDAILARGWAVRREDRPSDPRVLVAELRAALDGGPARAEEEPLVTTLARLRSAPAPTVIAPVSIETTHGWPRRRTMALAGAGVAVAVIAALAWPERPAEQAPLERAVEPPATVAPVGAVVGEPEALPEIEPVAPPPVERPEPGAAVRSAPRAAPSEARPPPPPALARVRRALAVVRVDPDGAAIADLADAAQAAVDTLPDAKQRARLSRRVAGARMTADAEVLAACVAELEAALAPP